MGKDKKSGYIELTRILMARKLSIPPDDVDMSAIFDCATRAIEKKIEKDSDEFILEPKNGREIKAIISDEGGKIVQMMFNKEYPFCEFVDKYENWYIENLAMEFLKIKMDSLYGEES